MKKHQSDVTCHRGHTSDRRLWDCPVCVQIEREKAKALYEACLKVRENINLNNHTILYLCARMGKSEMGRMAKQLHTAIKQYEEETPCK